MTNSKTQRTMKKKCAISYKLLQYTYKYIITAPIIDLVLYILDELYKGRRIKEYKTESRVYTHRACPDTHIHKYIKVYTGQKLLLMTFYRCPETTRQQYLIIYLLFITIILLYYYQLGSITVVWISIILIRVYPIPHPVMTSDFAYFHARYYYMVVELRMSYMHDGRYKLYTPRVTLSIKHGVNL